MDQVHANVLALETLETACLRFYQRVSERLPEIKAELQRVEELLEERRSELKAEIEMLEEQAANEPPAEDGEPSSTEREIEAAQENLSVIRKRIRKLEEAGIECIRHVDLLEKMADTEPSPIRELLSSARDDIKAYLHAGIATATSGTNTSISYQSTDVPSVSPAAVREKIKNAIFTSAKKAPHGIDGALFLSNGVKVVFKSEERVDRESLPEGFAADSLHRREKAASLIDEILGLHLVPPTEIIKYNNETGSAQLFKDGFEDAFKFMKSGIITESDYSWLTDRQRHDWHLFDSLTASSDRHTRNYLLKIRDEGGFDLILTDNGRSLYESKFYGLTSEPAIGEEIDSLNQERIRRFLDTEAEWRRAIVDLVGDMPTDEMITRAKHMLTTKRYERNIDD